MDAQYILIPFLFFLNTGTSRGENTHTHTHTHSQTTPGKGAWLRGGGAELLGRTLCLRREESRMGKSHSSSGLLPRTELTWKPILKPGYPWGSRESLSGLVKTQKSVPTPKHFWFRRPGWGLGIYVTHKFPRDTDAAGLGPHCIAWISFP